MKFGNSFLFTAILSLRFELIFEFKAFTVKVQWGNCGVRDLFYHPNFCRISYVCLNMFSRIIIEFIEEKTHLKIELA